LVGDGLIANGPRHSQGGIPLYHRGRAAGIEIEGGEPVLTRGVSQNPLLLSLASIVNQLAGGRALTRNLPQPHMALGGVTQPMVLQSLRGSAGIDINYDRLAASMSKFVIMTRVSDIDAAYKKKEFTNKMTNS
jgi:hypothetical protein